MRDLPRQLDEAQLAELFEGDTALVRRLAATDDPLRNAPAVIGSLTEAEKLEALNAHLAIGARSALEAIGRRQGADPIRRRWPSSRG